MKLALLFVLGLVLVAGVASAEVIARYGITVDGHFDDTGIRSGKDVIEKQTGTRLRYRGNSFSFLTGNFISAPRHYSGDMGNGLSVGKYYTNALATKPSTITHGTLGTYVNYRQRQSVNEVVDRATRGYSWDERASWSKTRSLFRQTFLVRR